MNRCLKILLFIAYGWFLAQGMFGPLFVIFAGNVGGDVLDITGAYTAYYVVVGILYFVVGKLADKLHAEKKIMTIGYAIDTVVCFGYLFVTDPMGLFITQIFCGVAMACTTPTWNTLYTEYLESGKKNSGWSYYGGGSQIIQAIAMSAGGMIISFFSFEVLFMTMGIVMFISTVSIMSIRNDSVCMTTKASRKESSKMNYRPRGQYRRT